MLYFILPQRSVMSQLAPCSQRGISAVVGFFQIYFCGCVMDEWTHICHVYTCLFFPPEMFHLVKSSPVPMFPLLRTNRTFQLPRCLHSFNFVQILIVWDWKLVIPQQHAGMLTKPFQRFFSLCYRYLYIVLILFAGSSGWRPSLLFLFNVSYEWFFGGGTEKWKSNNSRNWRGLMLTPMECILCCV